MCRQTHFPHFAAMAAPVSGEGKEEKAWGPNAGGDFASIDGALGLDGEQAIKKQLLSRPQPVELIPGVQVCTNSSFCL